DARDLEHGPQQGARADPSPPGGRARGRPGADPRRHPLQGGSRGGLPRPSRVDRRAGGHLQHPHPRRGRREDPHGRTGGRLRRRTCSGQRRL
ncbi:MAG: Acyl carrier protein, partial [uncultured Solirubrobacteraceae bacterium]